MEFSNKSDCLKLSKEEFKKKMDPLRVKMGELQRKAKEMQVPILIIFEGLEASGKGASINEILLSLDPRGYKVISHSNPFDLKNIPFKQYWQYIPGKGEYHIFDQSWYYYALNEKNEVTVRCKEINQTEKTLIRSGMTIIKFFIYVSKEVQKKRYKKAMENPAQAWKVDKEAWKKYKEYDDIMKRWNDIIERTNNYNCEWNIICADDIRGARSEIFRIIVENLETKLNAPEIRPDDVILPYKIPFSLDEVDLNKSLTKEEYKKRIGELQDKIYDLHHRIYINKIPVIIVYEGWDAGGKGGNIRRLVEKMDPRGYDVNPIAAPNDVERKKHYLWRFWRTIPSKGKVGIFDRSWYGRVMVERVEGFATKYQWKRAYTEIRDMERQWAQDGAVIIKFWIQISSEEQLKRFEERKNTPYKNWKITDEDWRNRDKWDQYKIAVEEMIARTSEEYAPWHIIPGNDKYYARVYALEIVVKTLEKRLGKIKK